MAQQLLEDDEWKVSFFIKMHLIVQHIKVYTQTQIYDHEIVYEYLSQEGW